MALTTAGMPAAAHVECVDEIIFTPMKSQFPAQTTPKRSERKRALFPTTSPQTSDLGHISPLGSSPDRYSSAPPSPDSQSLSPVKPRPGPVSPFGRKVRNALTSQHISPRRRFSELFGCDIGVSVGQSSSCNSSSHVQQTQSVCSLDRSRDIVPVDQLEQTVLSAMEDSDIADSPLSHASQHTPSTTPKSASNHKAVSEVKSAHPLTPSKRRSKFVPMSGSGSTTSTSPQSPKKQRRLSVEGKSKSAELPRARLSLFTENPSLRRQKDDGIYLTGRSSKTRKAVGQINAGVRTGIRRPPKAKPKKEPTSSQQGRVQSARDVASRSSQKRKGSPIILPRMRLEPKQVKLCDEELQNFSASASIQVRSKKHSKPVEQEEDDNVESMEEPITGSNSKNRIFKTQTSRKKRVATITVNKNVKITLSNGKFTLNKSTPTHTSKRRRKLFDREKQIEAINTFDDNQEDVADCTRKEVLIILKKLDEENTNSLPSEANLGPLETPLSQESKIDTVLSVDDNPLSPLSELASSTSTLSLNIGGDTLHLKESQVQALSQVPDLIMEEDDDDFSSSRPLEELQSNTKSGSLEDTVLPSPELKENDGCVANVLGSSPGKYFPIFNCKVQHKTLAEKSTSDENRKRKRSLWRPIGDDQYQIDAGQKRFGATECSECSTVYQLGDPEDEILHAEVHNSFKFLKHVGWKNEKIVGEYGRDRIVLVKPGDPKHWWTKVLGVLDIVDQSLGFASSCVDKIASRMLAYLYVSEKHIVGCLVAQPVKTANRMLLSESETGGIDCCSKEEFPVKCGVNRIWVHTDFRCRHIASNLVDCMRKNFLFGEVLSLEDIAFSSPTSSGKVFAEKYTGRKDYFVYMHAEDSNQ